MPARLLNPKADALFIKLAKTDPAIGNSLRQQLREAAKWQTLPKGWTQQSVEKFWASLTGEKKHKVTECMKRMQGKVDDTGAFCASLADKVEGPEWRKGPRTADAGGAAKPKAPAMPKDVKADVRAKLADYAKFVAKVEKAHKDLAALGAEADSLRGEIVALRKKAYDTYAKALHQWEATQGRSSPLDRDWQESKEGVPYYYGYTAAEELLWGIQEAPGMEKVLAEVLKKLTYRRDHAKSYLDWEGSSKTASIKDEAVQVYSDAGPLHWKSNKWLPLNQWAQVMTAATPDGYNGFQAAKVFKALQRLPGIETTQFMPARELSVAVYVKGAPEILQQIAKLAPKMTIRADEANFPGPGLLRLWWD